eukprot:c34020_g1_i1 orf=99-329(-)
MLKHDVEGMATIADAFSLIYSYGRPMDEGVKCLPYIRVHALDTVMCLEHPVLPLCVFPKLGPIKPKSFVSMALKLP